MLYWIPYASEPKLSLYFKVNTLNYALTVPQVINEHFRSDARPLALVEIFLL